MERLTKNDAFGRPINKFCQYRYKNHICHCDGCKMPRIYERLAEYEDLGVTPEQIREIDVMYRELAEKLAKYEKSEIRIDEHKNFEEELQKLAFKLDQKVSQKQAVEAAKINSYRDGYTQALSDVLFSARELIEESEGKR